jgi:N utilization substance protein B
MLSRRHLRIKALQALYAYFVSDSIEITVGEKNMLRSIEKIYELITYQLSFIQAIAKLAEVRIEDGKKKFYPTEAELNPNTKFIENKFLKQLSENRDYIRKVNAYRINWSDEAEIIRKKYVEIAGSDAYQNYMNSGKDSYEEDKAFILKIFKEFTAYYPSLCTFYEEKDIYWADDIDTANALVFKIIKGYKESFDEFETFPSLYNVDGKLDADEDKKFLVQLYRKTILKSEEYETLISEKTSNWEIDRIAAMDILLIKMAITEFLEFSSIPVKVTLNEYIELSKYYSTPKSRIFINGILDKMIADLKKQNLLVKTGRGLIG